MKPAHFDYVRAASLEEVVGALAEAGDDGKILAGGQSLAPLLALRLARPLLLVDVNRVAGLNEIRPVGENTVRVGALTRHSRLAEQDRHPLLAEAARWIGHAAIRSRGTTGGSIAHADPSAELPVAAAALGAVALVSGPRGPRRIRAEELFAGPFETSLEPDEMLTAVDFPLPHRWGFAELSRRQGDFGLVTVVAADSGDGIRIAVGGVGGVPYRPVKAEALLAEEGLTPATIDDAAALASAGIDPADDLHATVAYRRAMTAEQIRRALLRLLGETNGRAA
jgi:carbon-monoxide dehydrogenase medium subunit